MRFVKKVCAAAKAKRRVLYHVSPAEKLDSIMSSGLDPARSESSLKAVFLASDPHTASEYLLMHNVDDGVLFEIDQSKLSASKLGPDNYELQDYLDERDKDEYWRDFTWQQSLRLVHQVAYYGKISPKAFTRYALIDAHDQKFTWQDASSYIPKTKKRKAK